MSDWWNGVPVHERGIEIAADQKAHSGRYRLLAKLPCLNCEAEARRTRTILAQYAGPGGTKWLWTPGYKGLVNHSESVRPLTDPIRAERIPPRAWSYQAGLFRIAVCEVCKHGQPFEVTAEGINLNFEPAPGSWGRVAEG
ncbi:hypothetical protein [Intrasporangium sp. YIM S08009]|uniref:hypothetical protein n=1 Tax=Intrasporangium zincisolvens TaxID=3080018 RepID=UPI002B05ADA4|nr:hypothetical protein [Intrasporangium sp. YIM S08009]